MTRSTRSLRAFARSVVAGLVAASVLASVAAAPVAAVDAQTITFTLPAYVLGGTRAVPITLAGTASSGLPVSYQVVTPLTCSLSGTTLLPLGAGDCVVTANQAGDATWAPASAVTRTMKVITSAIKITFDQAFTVNGELRLSVPLIVRARTLVTMSVTTGEAMMVGKTVEVWRRVLPTGRWTRVSLRTIDRATLSATYRFFALPSAQYRWRWAGNGILHDAWSQTRTVVGL